MSDGGAASAPGWPKVSRVVLVTGRGTSGRGSVGRRCECRGPRVVTFRRLTCARGALWRGVGRSVLTRSVVVAAALRRGTRASVRKSWVARQKVGRCAMFDKRLKKVLARYRKRITLSRNTSKYMAPVPAHIHTSGRPASTKRGPVVKYASTSIG